MKNFSLCLYLVKKEIKKNIGSYLKQWFLFSLIFSIVITLYIVPESYRFMRVAPYEFSKYDLEISGLLYESDFRKLQASQYVADIVGVSNWNGMNIANVRNDKQSMSDVFFIQNIEAASYLLPDNKYLFKQGSYEENCAVVTVKLAKKLGIKLNDVIVIDWSPFKINDFKVQYNVSGILYETAYGEHVLADKKPAMEIIRKAEGRLSQTPIAPNFSTLYIQLKQPAFINEVQKILDPSSQIITLRQEILENEKIEVEKLANSNFKYEQYGIILIYLLIFYGYSMIRLKQKKLFYGILTMLGATTNMINLHVIIENILFFLTVTLTSVFITYEYFKYGFNFYLPYQTLINLTLYAILINLFVLLVVSLIETRKLSKQSLTQALVKE